MVATAAWITRTSSKPRQSSGSSSIQGRRPNQEDRFSACDELPGCSGCGFYAVYDGHGGDRAASFAAERMQGYLTRSKGFQGRDHSQALQQAFHDCEAEFIQIAGREVRAGCSLPLARLVCARAERAQARSMLSFPLFLRADFASQIVMLRRGSVTARPRLSHSWRRMRSRLRTSGTRAACSAAPGVQPSRLRTTTSPSWSPRRGESRHLAGLSRTSAAGAPWGSLRCRGPSVTCFSNHMCPPSRLVRAQQPPPHHHPFPMPPPIPAHSPRAARPV
jgi:hypothetical protein